MNTPLSVLPHESLISKFASTGIMFPDQWRYLPSYLNSVDLNFPENEITSPLRTSSPSPLNIANANTSHEITSTSISITRSRQSDRLNSRDDRDNYQKNPTKLNIWNPDSILSRLITHTAILLTFGVCSPVLSVVIVVAVILSIVEWKIMMGRYLFRRFDTILHFNPLNYQININPNHNDNNDNTTTNTNNNQSTTNRPLLVAIDSISGYCDVSGDERSGVDYTFVCLEDSLVGILISTGRCLIMMVSYLYLF